jgi:hypothetical protein
MQRVITSTVAAAAIAILISGMIAVSARSASAQQNEDNDAQYQGALGATGAAAQPEIAKVPIDVNGCWTGSIVDVDAGAGSGYLNFDQVTTKKGNLKKTLKPIKSKATHNLYVVWGNGSCAYGFGPGSATSTGFHEKISSGGKCKATIIGNLSGNDLTGSYTFHGCPSSFGSHSGNFSLTFDNTGDSCNIANACNPN